MDFQTHCCRRTKVRLIALALLASGVAGAQTTAPSTEPPPGQTYPSDPLPGQVYPPSTYPTGVRPGQNPASAAGSARFSPEGAVPGLGELIPQSRMFVRPIVREFIGDAYSLRAGQRQLEIRARQGDGPAMGEALGERVNRLEIAPVSVRLAIGESYSLRNVAVRAYGRDGELAEHMPLRVELEGPEGFLDLSEFENDGHTLRAAAWGVGRLWFISLVPAVRGEDYALPVVIVVR